MSNEFNLSKREPNIKIEAKEGTLEIVKDSNENIIFKTDKNRLDLNINFYTEGPEEWQAYYVFQEFFHRSVGRYYLDAQKDSYGSKLPDDFVNAEERIITFHSDKTNLGNRLEIAEEDSHMRISLISSGAVRPAKVMISKKESKYFGYYQEFNKLYKILCTIASQQKDSCLGPVKKITK